MNENVKKAWEALFAPPGNGSLLPGPRVEMLTPPTFVDNAYTVTVPADTPEVNIAFAEGGAANTLTIALPTALKCLGKKMVLVVAQTAGEDAVCTIAVTGLHASYDTAAADIANGIYLLEAVQVSGAIVWLPFIPEEIVAAS